MKYKDLHASLKALCVATSRARDRVTVDEAFKYIREVLRWAEEKEDNYSVGAEYSFLQHRHELVTLLLGKADVLFEPCSLFSTSTGEVRRDVLYQ